jgi:hypothetical protein
VFRGLNKMTEVSINPEESISCIDFHVLMGYFIRKKYDL